jgi:hypothetical protein
MDFSRNITTNLEIHGEVAYVRNARKTTLDASGNMSAVEADAHNYLAGIRHLTAFDLTTIVEYYHNGAGFSGDELENYFAFVNRAYNLYQSTGETAALNSAKNLADGAYGRFSAGRDYLYVRFSQKEPFDILYFTPALTWIVSLDDRSYSLTPELLYSGFTNWELRFRTAFITGGRNTEFGEKQNDYRIEFRVGYYF